MTKKPTVTFVGQLRRAFMIVVLLPVLCLGVFSFYLSYTNIVRLNYVEFLNTVQQNGMDLTSRMQSVDDALRYLSTNYTLLELLQMDETKYLELSQTSKSVRNLFYMALLSNPYYKKWSVIIKAESPSARKTGKIRDIGRAQHGKTLHRRGAPRGAEACR